MEPVEINTSEIKKLITHGGSQKEAYEQGVLEDCRNSDSSAHFITNIGHQMV